jgi:ferredoxin
MFVKAFYKQLITTGKVSICGMYPKTQLSHDKNGMPYFPPGYAIRITGDVKEISFDTLKEKASAHVLFALGVKDIEKYPAMTTFCMFKGHGEIFDYDFEMEQRSHKLLRTSFSIGDAPIPLHGVRITEECTGCGQCLEKCSFKAIYLDSGKYVIDHDKCDVCGDCYIVCPARAVEIVS